MRDDLEAAERAYQEILAVRPGDADATLGLAQLELLRRTSGQELAVAVQAADANPDDVPAQLLAADLQVLAGDVDGAFARLLDVVAGACHRCRQRRRQLRRQMRRQIGTRPRFTCCHFSISSGTKTSECCLRARNWPPSSSRQFVPYLE